MQTSVKDQHTIESTEGKSRTRLKQETAIKLPRPTFQWKKGKNSHSMNSPRKVKHVSFHQHCETVPDNPSCRMSSQFTEVFYRNPDCETQCEDLPHNGRYPSQWIEKYDIFRKANRALIGAGENVFLWYSAMSPMHFLSTIKHTLWSMHRHHYGYHSVKNVASQESNNEKYQDFSRSLMHGMQPSDDDDLQDVSVMSISLRSHKCQAHCTAL
jgi:hypothetical protein